MHTASTTPTEMAASQSTMIWRSPRARRSQTARSERPISRWISCVRPDCRPRVASRATRSAEDPGSSEYSAVSQPRPDPRSQRGTSSSTEAVHSTFVFPIETSTEPGANSVKSRTSSSGRQASTGRPSRRAGDGGCMAAPSECVPPTLPWGQPVVRGQGPKLRVAEVDPLGARELGTEETAPERRELSRIARGEEPVGTLGRPHSSETALPEDLTDLERGLLRRRHEHHVSTHHGADRAREEGVVRAAEQKGV